MGYKTCIALTLTLVSQAAFAWQPLVYPIRSQTAYQRSIDTATCYATANKQTKVNIAHESQLPPRQPVATKTSATGTPARPPLPPSSFSAVPPGTAMPAAASGAMAATAMPASSTGVADPHKPQTAQGSQANPAAHSAQLATANAASAATATPGSSETAMASAAETSAAASSVNLPPLPAPEPPMTQYWAAYGACMQARGYVVAQ